VVQIPTIKVKYVEIILAVLLVLSVFAGWNTFYNAVEVEADDENF
jgi:hypothetical protein